MAITLCQSLGQNIGMLRNKEQTSAGRAQVTAFPEKLFYFFFTLMVIYPLSFTISYLISHFFVT